ncbi:prepilin-type N-terminal cleavage/methylation domain-containing protein [Myxococcota bacterium]|nr:prepilin-type N-terminal cleavage/methylation domain-containing protein [Myxococcota bacterium]
MAARIPTSAPPGAGTERGFTLLEMLVAVAIMAAAMALLWTSFAGAVKVEDQVRRKADTVAMGRTAMERISRELSMAFLSPNLSPTSSYATVFKGQDKDPFDEAIFTSLSHEKLYKDAREGDQAEISYYREEDPDSDLSMLVHRESPRIDGDPERGGVVLPLAYRVKSFNLRYYDLDKKEWVDQWDTRGVDTPNRLPRAVEIALVVVDEDGEEHAFTTRNLVNRMNR